MDTAFWKMVMELEFETQRTPDSTLAMALTVFSSFCKHITWQMLLRWKINQMALECVTNAGRLALRELPDPALLRSPAVNVDVGGWIRWPGVSVGGICWFWNVNLMSWLIRCQGNIYREGCVMSYSRWGNCSISFQQHSFVYFVQMGAESHGVGKKGLR